MMSGNNCSPCSHCCLPAVNKVGPIRWKQRCADHPRCRCNWIKKTDPGCKCSVAKTSRFNRTCNPCTCYLERHRNWLEYLWKEDTRNQHKVGCLCCDICRKFHPCPSSNEPCKCLCTDTHKTHFFCNATDQNVLVARTAALRYKIRQSTKWLFLNLLIFIALIYDECVPTIVRTIIASINFLNVCYFIQNIVKLHVAVLLERPAYWTRNCLWEKNVPRDLTRYFECGSEGFFARYWQNFFCLVSMLRTVRSSPVGRSETEMGMEQELKTLGESILRACFESKSKIQFEDAKYRLPLMKRMKQPVCSSKQLDKYWKNYAEACQDEDVRLSKEQLPFRPDLPSTPLPGNQSPTVHQSEEAVYHEVAVSPMLRCSSYQYACEYDVHQCRVIPSGSCFDMMKVHHGVDYCSSLQWVANLKIWLCKKIKDIVEQFNLANQMLVRNGAAYLQIGVSSVTDLLTAFRNNEDLCSNTPILAFLTLTDNQSYLVWRYRVLASKPCLASYIWRSGGDPRSVCPPETGPCDSDIVLHFFCTYLDMNIPDLRFHPTKKRPFSDYYVISSNKLLQAAGEVAIVRQSANPPHFNVFVKGRLYEIPGGSSNLFQSLAYLIYFIKIYQGGKIGRVSLGRFGLNLLWILGDTT